MSPPAAPPVSQLLLHNPSPCAAPPALENYTYSMGFQSIHVGEENHKNVKKCDDDVSAFGFVCASEKRVKGGFSSSKVVKPAPSGNNKGENIKGGCSRPLRRNLKEVRFSFE